MFYRSDDVTNVQYETVMPITKTSKPTGEYVLLEILPNERDQFVNGIAIPTMFTQSENNKLAKGLVLAIGRDVPTDIGLKVGMEVLYDKWSPFGRPGGKIGRIIITKFDNLISLA